MSKRNDSAENADFMLWSNQFQKIVKARHDGMANLLRSYYGLSGIQNCKLLLLYV